MRAARGLSATLDVIMVTAPMEQLTLSGVIEKPARRRRRRAAKAARGRVAHRLRPVHKTRHPVHVTLRALDHRGWPSFRCQIVIAFAKRLAKMLGRRRGKVWADRYHAHVLRTPREARHALAYVLHNAKKHGVANPRASFIDPFSSAPSFDGWSDGARGPPAAPCAVLPRTWLLGVGWRRGGPLATTDAPKIQRGR